MPTGEIPAGVAPGGAADLAAVKWVWVAFRWVSGLAGSSAQSMDPTGNIIRSSGLVYGDLPGAIPTALGAWPALAPAMFGPPGFTGESAPVGSAANAVLGVQLGDRVAYWDTHGRAGIYTVTNLGSVAAPWELTRAADLPIVESFGAWRAPIEGVDGFIDSIPHHLEAPDPLTDWNSFSIIWNEGAVAVGSGAFASGRYSTAVGVGAATAGGPDGMAVGLNASATGDGGPVAIGAIAQASGEGSMAVGFSAKARGDYSQATGCLVETITEGVHIVGSYYPFAPTVGEGGAVLIQGIETTQTASFDVELKHMGRFIPCNHATIAIEATIPLNVDEPFPIGAMIEFGCQGAADLTIAIDVGGTLIGTTTATAPGQVLRARQIDTDVWWVSLTS